MQKLLKKLSRMMSRKSKAMRSRTRCVCACPNMSSILWAVQVPDDFEESSAPGMFSGTARLDEKGDEDVKTTQAILEPKVGLDCSVTDCSVFTLHLSNRLMLLNGSWNWSASVRD